MSISKLWCRWKYFTRKNVGLQNRSSSDILLQLSIGTCPKASIFRLYQFKISTTALTDSSWGVSALTSLGSKGIALNFDQTRRWFVSLKYLIFFQVNFFVSQDYKLFFNWLSNILSRQSFVIILKRTAIKKYWTLWELFKKIHIVVKRWILNFGYENLNNVSRKKEIMFSFTDWKASRTPLQSQHEKLPD